MNPGPASSIDPAFLRAVQDGDEDTLQQLYDDSACPHCVDVDWREEDDGIVAMVAEAIGRDDLQAEWDDEVLVITCGDSELRVPMQMDPVDRDTTIRAVNTLLQPEYEVRLISLSVGSNTHSFCVLRAGDWRTVEAANPQLAADHFLKLDALPNLVDELSIDTLPPGARAALDRMVVRNRQR